LSVAVVFTIALGAALLSPGTDAHAQRPVELGIDAMLAVHSVGNERVLEFSGPMGGLLSLGPLQAFRVGVYLSDRLSVEPSVGLNIIDEKNSDALTRLGLSMNVLYHFGTASPRGPFAGIGGNSLMVGSGDMDSQFGVHALLGQNVHLASGLYLRLSAGVGRAFESDDFDARSMYFATFGLSYIAGDRLNPFAERSP
jgi:hypothetical protein